MSEKSLVSEAWFPSSASSLTLFAAVTDDCNLRCTHCFANSGRPGENELSTQQWKSVLDQLANIEGEKVLFLTGGEPLRRSDIYELAKYSVRDKVVPAVLGTNGTLIDRSTANSLREAGVSECRVSLDGSNEEVNGLIRGHGSFIRALQGIRNLKNIGIGVTVRTTIMKPNKDDLLNIGDLLQLEGVSTWEVKHLIPSGRARLAAELCLDWKGRALIVQQLVEERNTGRFKTLRIRFMEGSLNFLYDDNVSLEDATRCPAGKRMLLIRPNGDVIPCGYLSDLVLGNVLRDDIGSLWTGSPILRQLREMQPHPGCKKCDKFDICGGGCLAHSFCPMKLHSELGIDTAGVFELTDPEEQLG